MADKDNAFDVIVLGAGPGGYTAAFRAADLGLKTALVNDEPTPGGVCLLRGCIPSKALLHAAELITGAAEAETWGLTFAKPKIDLDRLRTQKQAVVDKLSKGVGALAKARSVTYIQGRGRFTSSTALQVSHEGATRELTFGHAIIATGSRPAVPQALYLDDERWMDSTRALELPFTPKKLLVIGGGYIGMELGTVYSALGSAVTVVEGTDRLLGGSDADLVRPVQKRAEKAFAAIRLQTKVNAMKAAKAGIEVQLAGKDKEEKLTFDAVLVSVGRTPNSADLGLENTKAEIDERGFIRVDKKLQTAEPTLYAIGDVAGDPMLAHKASHEGIIAAEVIAGHAAEWDKRAIPAVVFTDPEIAYCGLTEAEAKAAGRDVTVLRFPWAASGRALTLNRTDGVTKIIAAPEDGRVLGVGIAGHGAGELIAEAVLAMEMGAVVEDMAATIHPHPTLSETLMECAELFAGNATHYTKAR